MLTFYSAVLGQLLLFTALLTPIELLWPSREQRVLRRGFLTDLYHFAISPLMIVAGTALVLAGLSATLAYLMPLAARTALASQPFVVQLVEVIVLSELFAYLAHRASHAVPLFWRFHAVHHSTTELDWLAAHRQHPLEAVGLLGLANLPALALGFSMEPLIGFVLFQKTYTAFLHANVRVGSRAPRWLHFLVATPRFHRWHHDGDDRRGHNFAGFLPIFDHLFGTYALPPGEPARFGTDEEVPSGYAGQLLFPLGHRKLAIAIGVVLVLFALGVRAEKPPTLAWQTLQPGVELSRVAMEPAAKDADRLLVVRVDPRRAKLRLGLASARDRQPRTAGAWCGAAGLAVAINAGMFRDDGVSNVGHLVDGAHVNSARWVGTYQSVLAFDPIDAQLAPAAMIDLDEPGARERIAKYKSVVQNLRLIKKAAHGVGRGMWSEQPKRWSEAAIAIDQAGRVLFLFSRAPYSMAEFNRRVLALPLAIERAMHVEGGPEASLAVHAGGVDADYFGSFETGFVENDGNGAAWPIPNVLGVAVAKAP